MRACVYRRGSEASFGGRGFTLVEQVSIGMTRNYTKSSLLLRALIYVAGFILALSAAEAKLSIGDPAPKLLTGKWIQGESVKELDTNHIYVVEFWSTWCGPCRTAIPHLNELWQKLKSEGVIVIGQDVWDSDDTVVPFVKKMGDQMTYRVALDDKSHDVEGFMARHWWKRGVDQHGIPNAFVINKQGRIAWIGHPMSLNEKLFNEIASGQYDLLKASAEYEKQQQEEGQWNVLNDKLFRAVDQKKWSDAASAVDELLKLAEIRKYPPRLQDGYAPVRLRILLGQKRYDDAYKFADLFSDNHPKDASRQNTLAWIIVIEKGVEQRNLVVAKKLAERANAAADGKDSAILDTLARVLFMRGEKSEAIAIEQKAIDLAPDQEKDRCRNCLADYQQGKLPEVKE